MEKIYLFDASIFRRGSYKNVPFSEITLSIPLPDQGIYFDSEIRGIEDLPIVFRDIADLDFRGIDNLLVNF